MRGDDDVDYVAVQAPGIIAAIEQVQIEAQSRPDVRDRLPGPGRATGGGLNLTEGDSQPIHHGLHHRGVRSVLPRLAAGRATMRFSACLAIADFCRPEIGPRSRGRTEHGRYRRSSAELKRSITYSWSSVELGVEGQREQAAACLLRDGAHSLREAEPLAHVGLQVDRGQVATRRDPGGRQLLDERSPVEPGRQANRVDEPRAAMLGVVAEEDVSRRRRRRAAPRSALRRRRGARGSRRASPAGPARRRPTGRRGGSCSRSARARASRPRRPDPGSRGSSGASTRPRCGRRRRRPRLWSPACSDRRRRPRDGRTSRRADRGTRRPAPRTRPR